MAEEEQERQIIDSDLELRIRNDEDELIRLNTKHSHLQSQLQSSSCQTPGAICGLTERERAEREDRERNYAMCGRSLACFAPRELHQFIRGIDLREVECLTISPDGRGVLCAMRDGICLFCHYAPPIGLRKRDSSAGRLVAVCLGTHQRYFLRFSLGNIEYSGPDSLSHPIDGRPVHMVAFGENWETFVVLYSDGSSFWSNVPFELEELLLSCENIAFISMGQNGQWFLRFMDDSWRAGGLSDDEERFLKECLLRDNGEAREITFGITGMMVRYNSGGNQVRIDSFGLKRGPLDYRNKIWFWFNS